jgi:hypothetical protein
MTQLATSLRFVDLPDVVGLLASVGCTGRLQLTQDQWTGNLIFCAGEIVGASLGAETGQAALEGIAIGILDGDLTYVDEPVSEDLEPLVSSDQRAQYLSDLNAEGRRLLRIVPSLRLVPRLVDLADSRVTISAAELHLIPVLVSGVNLDQVAQQHGLVRTVRGVARLVEAGLVKLDHAPRPASAWPASARVQAGRPPEAPAVNIVAPVRPPGPVEQARLSRSRLESARPPGFRLALVKPPVAVQLAPVAAPPLPVPPLPAPPDPRPPVPLLVETAAARPPAETAAALPTPGAAIQGVGGAILRFFGFEESPH